MPIRTNEIAVNSSNRALATYLKYQQRSLVDIYPQHCELNYTKNYPRHVKKRLISLCDDEVYNHLDRHARCTYHLSSCVISVGRQVILPCPIVASTAIQTEHPDLCTNVTVREKSPISGFNAITPSRFEDLNGEQSSDRDGYYSIADEDGLGHEDYDPGWGDMDSSYSRRHQQESTYTFLRIHR